MVEGDVTKTTRRALIFRLGATGRTLGYLEGTVTMEGQPRSVRRMDGDGNGLMTNAQDRLWIDLNRDGRWDAASEQFLYATILNLGGRATYFVPTRSGHGWRSNRWSARGPSSSRSKRARPPTCARPWSVATARPLASPVASRRPFRLASTG